jgi:hypothetical protein
LDAANEAFFCEKWCGYPLQDQQAGAAAAATAYSVYKSEEAATAAEHAGEAAAQHGSGSEMVAALAACASAVKNILLSGPSVQDTAAQAVEAAKEADFDGVANYDQIYQCVMETFNSAFVTHDERSVSDNIRVAYIACKITSADHTSPPTAAPANNAVANDPLSAALATVAKVKALDTLSTHCTHCIHYTLYSLYSLHTVLTVFTPSCTHCIHCIYTPSR